MPPRIFLSPPDIGEVEKSFVLGALESGWAAPAGPDLDAFEAEVAGLCGRKFGVALSSGTAALHLSLLALDVHHGDVVVCATMTFVATANAISYVGAVPVFVDSDIETGNMSPTLLEQALDALSRDGRTVAAVLVVDFLGKVADYTAISELCEQRKIPLVADSAEALGASHRQRPAGSFGEIAAVSFNGNKIVTTSGGGMVLTDNAEFARRVRHLATQAREQVIHYEHKELGYNYRLSNVLAALGRAQIKRLPEIISVRRSIREKYRGLFTEDSGASVFGHLDEEDNCWLTSIIVSPEASWVPSDLQDFLELRDIESRPLWKPMHLQPLYEDCESFVDGSSESLFLQGLTLPSGSGMTMDDWERVETSVRDFLATTVSRMPEDQLHLTSD